METMSGAPEKNFSPEEFLEHYGTKGMKWRQSKTNIAKPASYDSDGFTSLYKNDPAAFTRYASDLAAYVNSTGDTSELEKLQGFVSGPGGREISKAFAKAFNASSQAVSRQVTPSGQFKAPVSNANKLKKLEHHELSISETVLHMKVQDLYLG